MQLFADHHALAEHSPRTIEFYSMWLQQFDGALAAFDSALAHGGSEDCYFYKGVTCVRMKDYPKAIKMFQERMARSKTKDDPFGMKARDLINKIQGWMESDSSGAILLTE